MERNAERLRLVLIRHGRLDRLRPACYDDPIALAQQLVERLLLEILRAQAGDERLADVQRLDRHLLLIGQAKPFCDDDRLGGREVEEAAESGAGGRDAELERAALGE